MRWALLMVISIASPALAGCGGVFGTGFYGYSTFTPRPGTNTLKDGALVVTIDKMYSGGFNTNIFMEATVRNHGATPAEFDPGDMVVIIRDTGISYFHVTKGLGTAQLPPGVVVTSRTTLSAGQAIRGQLLFLTPQGDARAKAIDIGYRGAMVHFPD